MTAVGTLFAIGGIAFIDSGSRDRQNNPQQAVTNDGKEEEENLLDFSTFT